MLEVKDFSKEIVDVVRKNQNINIPEYLGAFSAGFVAKITLNSSFHLSLNPAFHSCGAFLGFTSYLLQRVTENELAKYVEDPRFERYGLDRYYKIDNPYSLDNPTVEENNIKSLKDVKARASSFISDVRSFISDVRYNPDKISKSISSKLKRSYKLNLSWLLMQTACPPLGLGSFAGSAFDSSRKSLKAGEIRQVLEIGKGVEDRIGRGCSEGEIKDFLGLYKKPKKGLKWWM